MTKYAKIKTSAELDKAIKGIRSERKKKEKSLEKDFKGFRNSVKPSNLMLGAVRRYSPYLTWSEIGLGAVRTLRKILSPK